MAESQFDDPAKVRLKMVRGSYLHLFKQKGFGKKNEGAPKFSGTGIIDPETKSGKANLDLLEDAIEFVGSEQWGKDWPKIKKKLTKDGRICLREGDEDADETDGMMTVTASNSKRPLALDENGDEVTEADDVIYSGCYGDMIVRVWAQDNDYGQRINAVLEGFKFRKDGDPFGGGSKTTADDFDDDEDEKPKSRGRSREDDDEKPKSRRSSRDDDDDEDEKPRGRRSSRDDDDDEDEKPKSRRSSRDDDEKPKSRRSSRDDDDDEPKSRRRSRSRDDDDDY